MTELVAAEIDGATFLVRTARGAPERPLFVQRSHTRLRLLERVLATLDELGLGESARRGTLVQAGAGPGIVTVAALRRYGFSRALACEPDPSAFRMLRLNAAANGLLGRVQALPLALDGDGPEAFEPVGLDGLLQRGLIGAGEAGLVWIEPAAWARILDGATKFLEDGAPLLLRIDSSTTPVGESGLSSTHTHFVRVSETATRAMSDRLVPIEALDDVISRAGGAAADRGFAVLAVRRTGSKNSRRGS